MSELLNDILGNIEHVQSLTELEDIWDACSDRMGDLKKAKTRKIKAMLNVGDTVRLSSRMKPKYLCEIEGTITELNGNKASLQLPDDPSLRRFSGLICVVPLSAIAKRVRKAT